MPLNHGTSFIRLTLGTIVGQVSGEKSPKYTRRDVSRMPLLRSFFGGNRMSPYNQERGRSDRFFTLEDWFGCKEQITVDVVTKTAITRAGGDC
jgi:hypothetical protein